MKMYSGTDNELNTPWGADNAPQPMDASSGNPSANQPSLELFIPAQERNSIISALFAIGQHVDGIHTIQHYLTQSIEALTNQILSAPTPTSAPAPAPTFHAPPPLFSLSDSPCGAPHFKESFSFDGSTAKVEAWIDKISNTIHPQHATPLTDYDKAIHMAGYLRTGLPKSWHCGICASQKHLLYDFYSLLADFCKHFSNSNISGTAPHKIKTLRQTGPCAAYASHCRSKSVCD